MRKLSFFVMALLALTLIAGLAFAEEKEEQPVCAQCGMFFSKSPTQVTAVIGVGDAKFDHIFESMGCYINYVQANYDDSAKFLALEILDYNTFGSKNPVMLNATKASYLYGTSKLKGSMSPFIATFATEDEAKAAQAELGGELLGYKDMMKSLAADVTAGNGEGCGSCEGCGGCGDAEAEAAVYACAMGCVDSDEPGKCPMCGMEMEKK